MGGGGGSYQTGKESAAGIDADVIGSILRYRKVLLLKSPEPI